MKIKQAFFTICISITHFFCVGNNNPPVIENIITIPDSINTGGSVLIICKAFDEEDKNSLSYLWDCTSGNITSINDKDSAIWIAPEESGFFSISCEVSDSNNGATIETVDVRVL